MDVRLRRLIAGWRSSGLPEDLARADDVEALARFVDCGGPLDRAAVGRLDSWVERNWRPEMDVAVLVAMIAAFVTPDDPDVH